MKVELGFDANDTRPSEEVAAEAVAKVGKKNDGGKRPWHLVPFLQLREVVDVLKHGAEEYGEDNWKVVPGARERYFSAAMRHIDAWWTDGEVRDSGSGLHPLAHAVCCLLFLMWFDREAGNDVQSSGE